MPVARFSAPWRPLGSRQGTRCVTAAPSLPPAAFAVGGLRLAVVAVLGAQVVPLTRWVPAGQVGMFLAQVAPLTRWVLAGQVGMFLAQVVPLTKWVPAGQDGGTLTHEFSLA